MAFLRNGLFALLITVLIFSDESLGSPSGLQQVLGGRKVLVRKTKLTVHSAEEKEEEEDDRIEITPSADGRCEVAGTVFAEGSAMTSPNECSFCYCIRGERRCVTPKCKLPIRGCKPRYRSASCCPTFYDCLDYSSTTTTSTTTSSTTTTKPGSQAPPVKQGCFVGNQRYFEGQFMPDVGGPCKACYCLRGTRYCTEIQCSHPDAEKGCLPIMVEGSCCPVGYDCEKRGRRENSKFANEDEPITDFEPENVFELRNSNLNSGPLENHIRIERQSQLDHAEDIEPVVTTEAAVAEDTTVHVMDTDIPTEVSEKDMTDSMDTPENIDDRMKASDVREVDEPLTQDSKAGDQETNTLEATETETLGDELVEEPAVTEPTSSLPTLSISKLLSKLKEANDKNKESISDILPDPITGTVYDEGEIYDDVLTSEPGGVPDFVSYDINVGTSLLTGENEPVGVGQVFPVEIEHAPALQPSTSHVTEEPNDEPSFLDTFLNLFTNGASKLTKPKVEKDTVGKEPSGSLRPPPFQHQPPPLPPPPPAFKSSLSEENLTEKDHTVEELNKKENAKLDLEAKPTIENEVRARPRPSPGGSVTRNELPIRRHPASGGSLRPGIFASRPNFPISKPPSLSDTRASVEDNLPKLPSDPIIEGGFEAIKPASNDTEDTPEITDIENEPTLPPSLPNLQIIPFVAADAVVNQGSPPDDATTGFTPKPHGNVPSQGDCREGGKLWKNGEVVAQRHDDPCVLCRCLLGKVICQRQECPTVPEACVVEDSPAEGECCPLITCDKASNVSIIDTLPIFRPIEKEEPEETSPEETPSRPIRPSPFAHLNRRPPFSSVGRPQKPAKSPSPSPRKPIIPPRLRPSLGKSPIIRPKKPETQTQKSAEKEETTVRPSLRRPIRPIISKNPSRDPPSLPRSPLRPSSSEGSRPRPYASLIRTGTRRPFIPPRRLRPSFERERPALLSSPKPTTTTTSTTTPGTTTSTTTAETTTTPKSHEPSKEELVLPLETHFHTKPPIVEVEETPTESPKQPESAFFENLFAGLISKEKPFLPSPLHSPISDSDSETHSEPSKPFALPPDLLLPKPLPPSDAEVDDDDLINFVQQDKFRIAQVEPISETIFDRRPPKLPLPSPKPILKPLPEIPESVKAQLPLGNDPILVSGLLELGGCNVYGRMFDIGERIDDISGRCKACQCTKVGVQCLPIC